MKWKSAYNLKVEERETTKLLMRDLVGIYNECLLIILKFNIIVYKQEIIYYLVNQYMYM